MICIFSRSDDQTTTDVMRWLTHLGEKDLLRINSDDPLSESAIEDLKVDSLTLSFCVGGRRIHLTDIGAVWYRKGRRWLCSHFADVSFEGHPGLNSYLKKRLVNEETRLSEYVHFLIEQTIPHLGSSKTTDLNKLIVLDAARRAGLLIPAYGIATSRAALLDRAANHPHITKPISEVLYLFETGYTDTGYFSYTERITPELMHSSPDHLSASFIQEEIQKDFEARVFVLEGRSYAMAIFSQSEEQTSIDFRHYHATKPNRMVPLQLSDDLERRITCLFTSIGLDTGSVDFIVDKAGNFFFLEVNPVGQFGWVSSKCNYRLEKTIAITLRDYDKRRKTQ